MNNYFDDNGFSRCALKWRMGHLLVKPITEVEQVSLPAVRDKGWLVECLKHSSVNLVRIDPKLGEKEVKFWADACQEAGKPIFLQVPASQEQSRKFSWFFVYLEVLINFIFASVLILLASPLMLVLASLIALRSPTQIVSHEWYVGKRGKLFQAIKFNTKAIEANKPLNHQISKEVSTTLTFDSVLYDLFGYLPQLFNVLHGDMTLTETVPYQFFSLLVTSFREQKQLDKLPHIVKDCFIDEIKAKQINLDTFY